MPRRLAGAAVVIALGLLAELLPAEPLPTYLLFGDQHVFIPTISSILGTLAIFAVGGFVSRTGFVLTAAAIAVLVLLSTQYMLYQIALPAGQADIVTIAVANMPNMISTLASAIVGAYLGEQVYAHKKKTI